MREVLRALRDQLQELGGLVSPLDDEGWSTPSACPGWTVADVLLHLAQTNEMAAASVRFRWRVQDGPGRAWAVTRSTSWPGRRSRPNGVCPPRRSIDAGGAAPRRWWRPSRAAAPTVVRGAALDLCRVAAQRRAVAGTDLRATGPDAEPVLSLARTFA